MTKTTGRHSIVTHADARHHRGLFWLAAAALSILIGGVADAQTCSGSNLLVELNASSSEPVGIQKTDALDLVLWGDAILIRASDPTSLQLRAVSPTSGTPLSTQLIGDPRQFSEWDALVVAVETEGHLDVHAVASFVVNEATMEYLWSLRLESCVGEEFSAPVVYSFDRGTDLVRAIYGPFDGLIFVGSQLPSTCEDESTGNHIHAVRISDAIVPWSLDGGIGALMDDVYGMTLDPIEDTLYVTTENTMPGTDSLWAVDVINGLPRWTVDVGRNRTAPVLRSGRLYVGNLAGILSARDPADGSEIWSLTVPDFYPISEQFIAPLEPPFHDKIVVRDFLSRIHMARDEGGTASWLWTTELPFDLGGPAVPPFMTMDPVAGVIYAPDNYGLIHQLDATTGAIQRSFPVDSAQNLPTSVFLDWPLDDNGQVEMLAGSEGGNLTRLCIEDGHMLRNGLGPSPRTEAVGGIASYQDTDTGDAEVLVHDLFDLKGPTLLTVFEAIATGPGPCDLGRGPTPCLEQMEFFLMGWDADPIQGSVIDPNAPGKLFHVDVTDRLTIVRGYGVTRYAGGDLVETSLLSFDLAGLDLWLPTAGSKVALMGRGSASALGAPTIPVVQHSGVAPTSLYSHPSGNFGEFTQMAVRIRGSLAGAGSVADLTVDKEGTGTDLRLAWSASCWSDDVDYAIYEGEIGNYDSHSALDCSGTADGEALSEVVTPSASIGSSYYLVVPKSSVGPYEGSYGVNGEGLERTPAVFACDDRTQELVTCQ